MSDNKLPEWAHDDFVKYVRLNNLNVGMSYELGFKDACRVLAPRLEAAEKLREALEFYASGAGIEVVDEGRNYNSRHVAYENDYSENGHMDKPVGFKAKEALEEYDKAVKGE